MRDARSVLAIATSNYLIKFALNVVDSICSDSTAKLGLIEKCILEEILHQFWTTFSILVPAMILVAAKNFLDCSL